MATVTRQQAALTITREARGRVPGDGVELAFGYWPGRSAPVVALHGLTATYVTFTGVAERLAGRRPLFAPDLRGRGDSGKPDGPYGMAQHARDVARAMRALALGPSVIVGHSMGAFIAAALAASEPELVAGLILVDGGFALPMTEAASQAFEFGLAKRIAQLRQTYASRQVYRDFWRSQPQFPPEDWSPWIEAFLDYELGGEPPRLQPKASDQGVRVDLAEGLKTKEITDRLEAIRVPVVMLRAEAGFLPGQPPLYPEPAMAEIRRCFPGLEVQTIQGTTHYTLVLGKRGASALADLIVEFSQRCRPKNSGVPRL
ncbi:MAG TPA: alpha/beta hydrolase [Terriglobales bacterium]|nr:alpha/beta hydrolase [Terriglobales bacterium]